MRPVLRSIGILAFWLTYPVTWAALYKSRRTRVLVVAEGRVLVLRGLLSDGSWQLPGGGLHKGEDPQAGAVREMREETGLTLEADKLLPLGEEPVRSLGFRYTAVYFAVESPTIPTVKVDGFEIIEATWLPLEQLRQVSVGQDVVRALTLFDKQTQI